MKICVGCSKRFSGSPRKEFCSQACYVKYYEKYGGADVIKTCVVCSASFSTRRKHDVTCSLACRIINNKKVKTEADAKYVARTKAQKKEYDKLRYPKIREKKCAEVRKWRQENRDKRNEASRRYYLINPQRRLYKRIQTLIKRYLAKRSIPVWGRTFEMLGYTPSQLEARLKSTLKDGMTWDDFLSGRLHIDHIRPDSSFCYISRDDPDFKKCWALDNLQLLWAKDNLQKWAKLCTKF